MEWYDNKLRIADRNITCYRRCYIKPKLTLPKKYDRAIFKGCIDGVECEGEINITYDGDIIFHTFNPKLNKQGFNITYTHPDYPFGKLFLSDTIITKLIVNNKNILKDFKPLIVLSDWFIERTSFYSIELGKKESIDRKIVCVDNCYTKTKEITHGHVSYIKNDKDNKHLYSEYGKVLKCIIPKGSSYILGWYPHWEKKATYYVSEKLIYKKIIHSGPNLYDF